MSKPLQSARALRRIVASRPYICASCSSHAPLAPLAQSRRAFTTSKRRDAKAPPAPPPSGYTRLTTRRLISLSGPDTVYFLQGVMTADIAPGAIPRSSGFYAAFLNAKGRVVYDTFIYPDVYHLLDSQSFPGKFKDADGHRGERWIVEVDADEVDNLYKHLRRYKLRAKLDLRIVELEELGVWQSWRDGVANGEKGEAQDIPAAASAESAIPVPKAAQGLIAMTDPRAPGLGRRILASGQMLPPQEMEDLEEATLDSYKIRRYLRGVQEGQSEILSERALPQESNIDYMSGISYRKGCYVGQELTIRTHHTGVVRKRALPVMLYPIGTEEPEEMRYDPDSGVEVPPLESAMEREVKEGRKRGLGKFLTGVGNIGIGVCRLEAVRDGGPYRVVWKVEGEEREKMVGVKAFVPNWHKGEEKKA